MTRPRTCRSTGRAATTSTTSRATSAASRTSSPRSSRTRSTRSPRARTSRASTAARWAPTTRCPGARTTRAGVRSTPRSATRRRPMTPSLTTHLKGAIGWAAGVADPIYSDCGATVLANYEQTKISAPPNLNEPIGFDQLPDGRILQTARTGTVRLHNPATGHDADHRRLRRRVGPADAAHLHQLRGRPLRPGDRQRLRHQQVGVPVLLAADRHRRQALRRLGGHADHADHGAAERGAVQDGVGSVRRLLPALALQVRRGRAAARAWTSAPSSRSCACRSTGRSAATSRGDIDFDTHNNLWLVTGDDNPAGGINAGGFGPSNDQLTDEQQTVRVNDATGGTFTLDVRRPDDRAAALQRHRRRYRRRTGGALEHRRRTRSRPAAARPTRRTSTCSSGAASSRPTRRR